MCVSLCGVCVCVCMFMLVHVCGEGEGGIQEVGKKWYEGAQMFFDLVPFCSSFFSDKPQSSMQCGLLCIDRSKLFVVTFKVSPETCQVQQCAMTSAILFIPSLNLSSPLQCRACCVRSYLSGLTLWQPDTLLQPGPPTPSTKWHTCA